MAHDERIILYIYRAKQLCTNLKATDATVTDQEFAITVLFGLPSKYWHLIVASDAVTNDEKFMLEFVKSWLILNKQRVVERFYQYEKQPDLALFGRTDLRKTMRQFPVCSHCNCKGHVEPKCWQKFTHLKPDHKSLLTESSTSCGKTETSFVEDNFD